MNKKTISAVMKAMGRKGGKRSLETMSDEERKVRAIKASKAAAKQRTKAAKLRAKGK